MHVMAALFAVCFYVLCFQFGAVYAQLSPNFYANSCPHALNKIQEVINRTVSQEPRMGASLLRLHFHDCFVNGCDASVLLDNTITAIGEKTAVSNINSLRGFEVIDAIKSQVESLCPRVVSCADIVAVAARDSVVALGGPTYNVQLGRKDSFAADILRANLGLPLPIFSLNRLKDSFATRGLSVTDLVALSGAHTVGQVTCQNIRGRIYAPSKMNPNYAASLREKCPIISGNRNPIPFDGSPNVFDNTYFKDLVNMKGLLHSDQVLYNNDFTDSLVYNYSTNAAAFFADFKIAMVKLGNINPLTGARGEIRTNCRMKNGFF